MLRWRCTTDTNDASLRNTQAISALAFDDVFVFRHVGIMMRTYVCYER